MIDVANKLFDLLTIRERVRALLLLIMILISALLDVLGVVSIMPFIAVLANPEVIENNNWLSLVYIYFEFNNTQDFLFFLGIFVFAFLVTSLAFKALTAYAQLRFTLMREYSIARRLIEVYLRQPYAWFLNRKSSELGKNILSEVTQVVQGTMLPLFITITQLAAALMLIVMLFVVDSTLALVVSLVLGFAYFSIYQITKKRLSRTGYERQASNEKRFEAVNETFSAIKEIKMGRLEEVYVNRFAEPAATYALSQASAQVISQLPRFAMEAISFGGILLVILYLISTREGLGEILPLATLYAFAGYRLMPALQQIYASISHIKFHKPALDSIDKELALTPSGYISKLENTNIILKNSIQLIGIEYQYPSANLPALYDINLNISANSTIALVGTTGSGKTTLIDLILGLLEPKSGSIKIDGHEITSSNVHMWQKSIGYVPQQIYLADATIASNIAFGVSSEKIDMNAVERAAKIANLHEFVTEQLSEGYKTLVGERGVRLSGGQRQRIGIARALYNSPKILIFDEATSALDNITEQAVMDALNNLNKNITTIIIAHRLTTVRQCDQIFLLKSGSIIANGSFEDLRKSSDVFRQMTEI
jgi:ABC-type multidrug transport system fused ATPase/permease subunit